MLGKPMKEGGHWMGNVFDVGRKGRYGRMKMVMKKPGPAKLC
jgi:hypothetical protein